MVVMDRIKFITEANQELLDKAFYLPIDVDPTHHIQNLVLTVVREALVMGLIDSKLFEYLQVQFPRTPIFDTLPKIPKGLDPLPGRPVISGCRGVL